MQTDHGIEYRRALEALRNGVPNSDAVSMLGSHQTEAENAFFERLGSVESSAREGRQVPGLLISGGFGSGKSHLLDYLEHLAISKNFVCSRVVISKETPLFDPAKIYQAAIDAAVVPGLRGEAIREIAQQLQPESRRYAEFFAWAGSPASGLGQLFTATVLLHEKLGSDPELLEEITAFWSGERLALSRIRQGLKRINCSGMYVLEAVKIKDLALQRFLFTSRLILAAGYSGWVLLIDEVELVGRYSLLQRGRSYAELARWMGRVKGETYPGLLAVAAITDDFGLAVLQERSDRDIVGPRLRGKETEEYTTIAKRAEVGMRLIEREALTLRPPGDATLGEAYRRLKEMHAKAYDWSPPDLPAAAATIRKGMRSHIRRWVNDWDLKRLYPGAQLCPEEEQELKQSYLVDTDLERPSEGPEDEWQSPR
ncbi:MAG TPA: BREX system ATP-binding domain-containing protein [Bryobacteraceae bacterium]|nr:BREX system ATP-binding domain-containing protein [Bryobacteraceae bacterium]